MRKCRYAKSSTVGSRRCTGRAGRALFGLLCTYVFALSAVLGTGASAAAAGCPNEAIREEQGSTYLPDCMAFEMVSPPHKESKNAANAAISADGDRIAFISRAALGQTPGLVRSVSGDVYVASRDAATGRWEVHATAPPPNYGYNETGTADLLSPNFDRWIAPQVEAGQYQSGEMTIYEGDLGGHFVPRSPLLKPLPGGETTPLSIAVASAAFEGSSADLSHLFLGPGLLFQLGRPMTTYMPEDPQGTYGSAAVGNTYVLATGSGGEPELSLLSRDADGKAWGGTCGSWLGGPPPGTGVLGRNQGAISPDGNRVFFSTRPAQPQPEAGHPDQPVCGSTENPVRILERTEGSGGVQISELLPGGPAPTEGSDFFEGASADGTKVYFTTNRPLAGSDSDSGSECVFGRGVEGCDLYLYDSDRPAGDRVVQVSAGEASADHPVVGAGAKVDAGVTAISGDGSLVYFVAEGALTSTTNSEGDAPVAPAEGTGTPSYASGFATTVANSDQVTVTFVLKGTFEVGQAVTGANIPSGTTITAVAGNTLTLSANATASGTFATITAAAKRITGVSATSGEFVVGETITGPAIPTGTTITAVSPGALEISSAPTDGGVTPLSAGAPNLYVFDAENDRLAFIGTLAAGDQSALFGRQVSFGKFARAVPLLGGDPSTDEVGGDGHVLFFDSRASLTANDADGGHLDMYRYDAVNGQLRCISCAPGLAEDKGDFDVEPGPDSGSGWSVGAEKPQADFAERSTWTSEDGTSAVFGTDEQLLGGSAGGAGGDSYLWKNGALYPVPGSGPELSHDGQELAFETSVPLLPTDIDSAVDVYVARADGGFVESSTAGGTCQGGESCQGPPSEAPGAGKPGSMSFAGSGNVKAKRHRPRHHKRHRAHRHDRRSCKQKGKGRRQHRCRQRGSTHRDRATRNSWKAGK